MIKITLNVNNPHGLHARPASRFVQLAQRFQSELKVIKTDRDANAKSLVSILSLGIDQGSTIMILGNGPDEEEAVKALKAIIEATDENASYIEE